MGVGGQRHAPVVLPRERPGTHSIGSWVGPRAGLDGCGKSHPNRDSIPGPSCPQRVAIPTELSRPTRLYSQRHYIPDVHNEVRVYHYIRNYPFRYTQCSMCCVADCHVETLHRSFVASSGLHREHKKKLHVLVLLQIRVTTTKHFSTFSASDSFPRSQLSFNQTNQIQFLLFDRFLSFLLLHTVILIFFPSRSV